MIVRRMASSVTCVRPSADDRQGGKNKVNGAENFFGQSRQEDGHTKLRYFRSSPTIKTLCRCLGIRQTSACGEGLKLPDTDSRFDTPESGTVARLVMFTICSSVPLSAYEAMEAFLGHARESNNSSSSECAHDWMETHKQTTKKRTNHPP